MERDDGVIPWLFVSGFNRLDQRLQSAVPSVFVIVSVLLAPLRPVVPDAVDTVLPGVDYLVGTPLIEERSQLVRFEL